VQLSKPRCYGLTELPDHQKPLEVVNTANHSGRRNENRQIARFPLNTNLLGILEIELAAQVGARCAPNAAVRHRHP